MKEKSLLLGLTGDMPLFRILDFLVENKGMDFTKKDIAREAHISRASLFNYWKEIEKHGIVRVTRSFGKTKLYTLDSNNPVTKRILDLEMALINEAMSKEAGREERKRKEIVVSAQTHQNKARL